MPSGINNIPPGGLPSRPRNWKNSRRIDLVYIKELESELVLARSVAKTLEIERNEALRRKTNAK